MCIIFAISPVNFLTVKAIQRKHQNWLMKAVFVEISCVSKASKRCYITFFAYINVKFMFPDCVGTAMKVLCASYGLRKIHTPNLPGLVTESILKTTKSCCKDQMPFPHHNLWGKNNDAF
mmetsp:Transcript_28462/g.58424  ORF Transcript_28462/g.58424 Transcript_28462/m.58424 type:complete len:119 (+) Transcript_28462:4271-4627(+)